jgi:hypothetical protein
LKKRGVEVPFSCSARQAARIVAEVSRRDKMGLASFGQMKVLVRYGYDARSMTRARASVILDALKDNGWRALPLGKFDNLRASRNPGEEG